MAIDNASSSLRRRILTTGSILTKSILTAADSSSNVVINSKIPPHHTLTSLSLTHVQFSQNDLISKLLAYVTLTPLCIICGYVAVVLTSRDLKPLVMFAGQAANELLNLVLKHLVKQARPTEYLGDGYGMPSSHSQFMAYFATYMLILMYRSAIESPVEGFVTHSLSSVAVIWSLLVVYSRVHLYYHTWQQVVAGTICGCIFAITYYIVVQKILRPAGIFEWIVAHPLVKELYIKDTDAVPNLAKYEWESWQKTFKLEHTKQE